MGKRRLYIKRVQQFSFLLMSFLRSDSPPPRAPSPDVLPAPLPHPPLRHQRPLRSTRSMDLRQRTRYPTPHANSLSLPSPVPSPTPTIVVPLPPTLKSCLQSPSSHIASPRPVSIKPIVFDHLPPPPHLKTKSSKSSLKSVDKLGIACLRFLKLKSQPKQVSSDVAGAL